FIREVRQWSQMPILVLSARTEETDKIAALDAGAIEIVLSFLKVMQRLHYTLHWLKKVISLKKNF
ncbi:MAG: hypothetical protein E6953_07745, partial [Veillonella sp.]|nr:hypothetical protein [Veillonella sp.]